jgi:S-formylglutathione hydrolase
VEKTSENKMFGGQQLQYRHNSDVLDCEMLFSIFLPPQAKVGPVPVLYWLSGLTCTDQNFVTKAGAQQHATEHGIAIVCPDTSPRGKAVPDDPEGHWDFGLGAGFYVNATQKPWLSNYQMYDYVVRELPTLVNANFPIDAARAGISGHSMGGHGALTIALNNLEVYQSVSAFSPIVAPSQVPWGNKAFSNYLGPDKSTWMKHDACKLVSQASHHLPILVDQGDADGFLEEQLRTHLLQEAADKAGYPMTVRMQPGYDHSYFFIASFIGEHIAFHAEALNN